MKTKTNFFIILIIIFRISDLISTHYALLGQNGLKNELNLLVRSFNINSKVLFYLIEVVGILLLLIMYLFSLRHKNIFRIKVYKFKEYFNLLFYKKKEVPFFEYLYKTSIKNSFTVIGQIIPNFIIWTSSLYILNNILVYKANTDKYYYKLYIDLNSHITLEYIIYIFPILLFVILISNLIYKNFKKHQILYCNPSHESQ